MTTEGCWQNLVMASLRIRPGIVRRLIRPRKAIGQQLVKLRLMTAVIVNGKVKLQAYPATQNGFGLQIVVTKKSGVRKISVGEKCVPRNFRFSLFLLIQFYC